MEKGVVGFHHIVGSHIDGDDAAGLPGQPGGLGNQFLVLDQIAFDVEIVVAPELFRRQVFGAQLQRGAHIIGKSPFGIGSGDENHTAAAGLLAVEHLRPHPVLLHRAFEEVPQIVVSDFAQKARRHPEDGGAGNGIGGRSSGDILDAVFLEGIPDAVSGFHIHVLHTSQGKVKLAEEAVVRKDGQDVGKRIADAKDGFHRISVGLS